MNGWPVPSIAHASKKKGTGGFWSGDISVGMKKGWHAHGGAGLASSMALGKGMMHSNSQCSERGACRVRNGGAADHDGHGLSVILGTMP